MSIIVMYMTTLFALLKLQHLLMRKNPSIVTNVEAYAFDHTDKYNLVENDFMMAVTVRDYDSKARMDPRYV